MKKLFGIFSLSILLFSTFAPSFTYANEDINELTDMLEEAITQTELDLGLNNLNQNSNIIYNLQEVRTAELLDGSGFNVEIKKLANNNSSEMTYNKDDNNIESIVIADTNTEGSSVIVSSSASENPVYAWYDGDEKTIYLYSEADTIYLNEDSSFMFYKLKGLRGFQIDIFDTTKVKSMKYMFGYYQGEEAIDLRNLDLSKVEDMSFMYYGSNITSINLSGMDLNNVTTMLDMFYSANNLVSVDFTNIQLNGVKNIDTMFPYYDTEAKLEEVKFTNAKLGTLERIGPSLFYNLNNLEYVDFSGADLHSLENAGSMFNQTHNIKYINFDYADLRSLKSLGLFNDLQELTGLKFSHTILSGLSYGSYIISQAPKLKEIDFSYADLRNYKGGREGYEYNSLRDLIYIGNGYVPNLEIINFSNADLRSLTSLNYMFGNTTTLKEVNFENTRLDSLTTMENMFYNAKIPEKLIFKNNNMLNLKNMKQTFYNSYSGNIIDFSGFDLSSVETMENMFYDAKDIKKVSFKNKNLKNVITMADMFYNTKDLEYVDFEGTEFEKLVNVNAMFQQSNIKEFYFTGKELRNLANTSNMFYNSNIEKVDFSNTKFSSNTYMGTMFGSASKLKEAIFKNFEAGGNMGSFFQNCTSLEKIDFSNVTILSTYMGTFVYQADNLKEVNFSNSKFIGNGNYSSLISNTPILEKADFSNTIFSGQGTMYTFFDATEGLKEVNFSGAKFIGIFTLQKMFADKPNLEKINFENSEINGNMHMREMFKDSTKLEELDLSSWDTSISTDMNSMFKGATNLKTIYVGNNFKTDSVTNSENMFSGTISIVGGNGTTYNPEKIDKEYAVIDDENNSGYFTYILDKPYTIEYELRGGVFKGEVVNTYTTRNGGIFPKAIMTGFEFAGWYETGATEPFTFTNTTKGDKILYAQWKSLEEKVEETTTENVVYTNTTTVTVGDETTEETLSGSTTLTLVSKEVESNEVKKEEGTTKVQDSEIKVTSDKIVEYEGGLEVYLEKTENVGTENVTTGKVEGTIKFSAPVAVKIPVSRDAEYVKVQVKHGNEDFGFKGLTLNPVNECNNGEAVNVKYNGEDVEVKNNNGDKYATIYTCSASTFVAYTENIKPVIPQPSAGGGRTITTTKQETKTVEQEHNSADIVEVKTTNKTTDTTSTENIQQQVQKVSTKSLTRGEVAVMTNILLEVYPQLVEGKQELDDVTNACSNYADEQSFTKDEKKAITRLCKLSIMGIHNDSNEPLEEFLVNNKSTNDEFSKVINRSIENYNEKDLSTIKDALKKLEGDEDNVVFGTVYNVFMSIKSFFN